MINLEPATAQAAKKMVLPIDPKGSQNLINKALLVLSEQGVFAFGLFLASRKRDEDIKAATQIHSAIMELLKTVLLADDPFTGKIDPAYYKELTSAREKEIPTEALHRLILTKQLMEIALTYGRYYCYYAKALA